MKVTINGKEYYSMYEACATYNVSRNKVSKRLKADPSLDIAQLILEMQGTMKKPVRVRVPNTTIPKEILGIKYQGSDRYNSVPKYYEYKGQKSYSWDQHVKNRGFTVDPSTVLKYLTKATWQYYRKHCVSYAQDIDDVDIEQIWQQCAKDCDQLVQTHNASRQIKANKDKLDIVLNDKDKHLNIDDVKTHLKSGMSIDDAIAASTTAVWKFTCNGKDYYSIDEYLEQTGKQLEVSVQVAKQRINAGESAEAAILARPITYRKKLPPVTPQMWGWSYELHQYIAPNGEMYPSKTQMVKAYGWTSYGVNTINRRLAYGMPLEKALVHRRVNDYVTNPKFKDTDFGFVPELNGYSIDGKNVYDTYRDMCFANGISVIMWRITCENQFDKQWTIDHRYFSAQEILFHDEYCSLSTACLNANIKGHRIGIQTVWMYCLKNQCVSMQQAFDAVYKLTQDKYATQK